jgi:cytoplasmic iron level regulating protein YaaA (DUF328/UPF0246 family)
MIIFPSSKGQDFSSVSLSLPTTEPGLQHKARELNALLRTLEEQALQQLMGISELLAKRTRQQILFFHQAARKPALLTFCGEAFRSLDAAGFTGDDLEYTQGRLRILSGLYGVLRPLDLIAPHRLEMGYRLANPKGVTLYPFWSPDVTAHLNAVMQQEPSPLLINLASLEYSKVVAKNQLCGPWIDVQFKEEVGGTLRSVAIHAKRARGMMANDLLKNRIEAASALTDFNGGGYRYRPELSAANLLIFTRPQS